MKKIIKIASAELRMLFCSPIVWFLLIVFIIQSSVIFTGLYREFTYANEWEEGVQFMTSFRFIMRMWGSTTGTIYYYIPLLTMGIISNELSSGSIKLLYASPITNTQIVLGKFFSTVIFALVICGILSVYMVVANATIVNFELGAALCGLVGIFLLACTYIAIGLFMSSLTSYQFIAAVGTFIILMLLSLAGGVWQEYDFIRDITYWLSINGRVFTFISGMLCSEDVIYFPVIMAMFLSFTVIRLDSKRRSISRKKVFIQYFLVVVAVCFIGYLSSRPKLMCYYDATHTKDNTLTKQSLDMMKQIDGRLKITGYANVLSSTYNYVSFPSFVQRNREIFKLYERFKPDTDLKMVYYYDSITNDDRVNEANYFNRVNGLTLKERAAVVAKRDMINPRIFKSPEYLRERGVNLLGERTMVWLLELNDKKVFLRFYSKDMEGMFPKEAEISAAMSALVKKLHKVGAVRGEGMRTFTDDSDRNYFNIIGNKDTRYSLINQGFDVTELDITSGVPQDIDILMIADMHVQFDESENRALKDYIERGGNLLILSEQHRREVMNPMLKEYFGVKIADGTLVQYRLGNLRPDVLVSTSTAESEGLSFMFKNSIVSMLSASALVQVEDKGFKYTPLYVSDTLVRENEYGERENRSHAVWNELESLDFDAAPLTCNSAVGEKIGDYTTAIALSRNVGGKEQRVVIAGDADFLSTKEYQLERRNNSFANAVFHYLSNNEMPFDTRRPVSDNTKVEITEDGNKILSRLFMFVFPLLFLVAALFIWIRRRSR